MNAFWTDVFTALGLALTGFGAFVAARAVIMKKEDAIKVGITRVGHSSMEKNVELPMVQNLLAASAGAQRGLWLVVIGTTLQIIPVIVRLFGSN
ncbi:MAG: hypothetical protein JXR75_09440 [Rhodobacteraceae bacterium]|nr:hypothetical protein [Paracoccaceae bacterium]